MCKGLDNIYKLDKNLYIKVLWAKKDNVDRKYNKIKKKHKQHRAIITPAVKSTISKYDYTEFKKIHNINRNKYNNNYRA